MQKKFRIIAEYECSAPSVSMILFDNVETAFNRVVETYMAARRVWICEVTEFCDGSIATGMNEILAAENGVGVGQFAP